MHLTPLFQSSVGQKCIKRWPRLCRADLWFPRIAGRRRGGCRPDLEDCRGGEVSSQLLQHRYAKIWIGNSAHFFRPPKSLEERNLWVYSGICGSTQCFPWSNLQKGCPLLGLLFFRSVATGLPYKLPPTGSPWHTSAGNITMAWLDNPEKWIVLYVTKSFTPRIMDDNVIQSYPHAKK